MKKKWAQLTKEERAYEKLKSVRDFSFLRETAEMRKLYTTQDKRDRNRYYQLLGHWCALKKSNDAQTSK